MLQVSIVFVWFNIAHKYCHLIFFMGEQNRTHLPVKTDVCTDVKNMWCDLEKSVGTRICDIFSFLIDWSAHLEIRGAFCWKTHLNRSISSKVMSNWMILRTIEKNRRNSFPFLAIYDNQYCRLPTGSNRSQQIYLFKFEESGIWFWS